MKYFYRKLERKHKKSGLPIDMDIFDAKCAEYEDLRKETKHHYYNDAVCECAGDQGAFFFNYKQATPPCFLITTTQC